MGTGPRRGRPKWCSPGAGERRCGESLAGTACKVEQGIEGGRRGGTRAWGRGEGTTREIEGQGASGLRRREGEAERGGGMRGEDGGAWAHGGGDGGRGELGREEGRWAPGKKKGEGSRREGELAVEDAGSGSREMGRGDGDRGGGGARAGREKMLARVVRGWGSRGPGEREKDAGEGSQGEKKRPEKKGRKRKREREEKGKGEKGRRRRWEDRSAKPKKRRRTAARCRGWETKLPGGACKSVFLSHKRYQKIQKIFLLISNVKILWQLFSTDMI